MAYTRQDLAEVMGSAFEWIIAMEHSAKSVEEKKLLLKKIKSFNKVIETLRFTIDELPTEDTCADNQQRNILGRTGEALLGNGPGQVRSEVESTDGGLHSARPIEPELRRIQTQTGEEK